MQIDRAKKTAPNTSTCVGGGLNAQQCAARRAGVPAQADGVAPTPDTLPGWRTRRERNTTT
ncbi:MAG: hypothetical protein RMN25_12555 [Anaerolineae bacterium]|nr:hypothetical protein [Thermoflexales bacterium]MDW8408602.1 hypothetical protein [Anaerolineae bacterium]